MRIAVLEAAARKQRVALDQRVDDRLVGVALLAVVVDDARRTALAIRAEARRVLGQVAGIVDGEREARVDAALLELGRRVHPGIEVLAAVAGRGVHEAGAGVVGDVVAGEHRHGKFVAAAEALERMGKRQAFQALRPKRCEARFERHLGLGGCLFGKCFGKDQLLARLRTKVVLGGRDLVEAIADARRIVDGAVAGDGPGRRRPDDDVRVGQRLRAGGDRELHPDRVALVVLVLDLGLGQRGALDHRPHHRLGAAIELARHRELQQLAGDARLGVEVHRRVGIVEIADDAEPLELGRLHVDPAARRIRGIPCGTR